VENSYILVRQPTNNYGLGANLWLYKIIEIKRNSNKSSSKQKKYKNKRGKKLQSAETAHKTLRVI